MKVSWSTAAQRGYSKTIDYLEDTWGDVVVSGFRKKVRQAIKSISKNPAIAPISPEMDVRRFVVTKHNIIVYTVTDDEIYIVAFVDSNTNHPY